MTDHQFDRRDSDANAMALSTRVGILEKWAETMDLELRANTRLTKQVHENTEGIVAAVEGTKEMWDFLSKWGRRIAIFAKYVGYIAGAVAAVWAVIVNFRR